MAMSADQERTLREELGRLTPEQLQRRYDSITQFGAPGGISSEDYLGVMTPIMETAGIAPAQYAAPQTLEDHLALMTQYQSDKNDVAYQRTRQEAEQKFGDEATAAFSEGGFIPGLNMTETESAAWKSEQAFTRARGTQLGLLESIRGLGPAISQEELNRLITRGRDIGTAGLARSQEQLRESAAGRGLGDSGALLSSQQSAFDRLIREQASGEAAERDLARQQNLAFEASKIGMGEDALTRLMELDRDRNFLVSETGGTVQDFIGSPTALPPPAAPLGAGALASPPTSKTAIAGPDIPSGGGSLSLTATAPPPVKVGGSRVGIKRPGTLDLRRTSFTAGNTVKA